MFIDENRNDRSAADLAYDTGLDEEFLAELSDASYITVPVNLREKYIVLFSASIHGDSLLEMANARAIDELAAYYTGLRSSTAVYMWANCLLLDFKVLAIMDDEDKASFIDLVRGANADGILDDDIYNELDEEWWDEYGVEAIKNLGYEFTDEQRARWEEMVRYDCMIWVADEGYLNEVKAREVADYVIANY